MALALGGRTIEELKGSMTLPEFHSWMEFYKLFPFDDFHRFHRPAAMVANAMGGTELDALLGWLQPDSRNAGLIDSDLATLRAFGFKSKAG